MEALSPKHMEGFVANGIHVLENVKDIPPAMFPLCSGIIVISSQEMGFVISSQGGAGVAVKREGDKWSAPVAVTLTGMGMGVVFGGAEKDVLIVLNHLAMKRLLEGKGQLKVGVDMGFASGKGGANMVGADIAMSNKGGLGSSYVYTFSKGCLLSAEVEFSTISNVDYVNKEFYGSSDVADILNGKAKVSDEALVTKLHDAIKKLDNAAIKKPDNDAIKKLDNPVAGENVVIGEDDYMEA